MDPRLRKLRAALGIMGLGTLVAVAWCAWQGWVLGRGFPDNTYLFLPRLRFSDWTAMVQLAAMPTPYAHALVFYFPAAYVMFLPCVWLDTTPLRLLCPHHSVSLVLYLVTVALGTVWLQGHALRDVLPSAGKRLLASLVLALGSYALIFGMDRGNTEPALALFVGGALLYCRRARFGIAALLLSVPILMKLYPILMLALFLRRGHWRYLIVPTAAFFLVSWLALLTFSEPPATSLALWQRNMTQYNSIYMIAGGGFSGCASPWNALKAALLTADHLRLLDLHAAVLPNGQRWVPAFIPLAQGYNEAMLALTLAVVLFATFVEREFFRRALLFLLVISICAQAGADYKLIWVHLALVVAILLPARRRLDFAAVVLLALVLVPKKEILFPYLGPTDSGHNDVSLGVLVDPVLILAAIALAVIDGWRERRPAWSLQRCIGLSRQVLDLTPLRGRWRGITPV